MSAVHAVALTGRGLVRPGNEDAALVFEWLSQTSRPQVVELQAPINAAPLVCAVADGMGGHAAGEVASMFALSQAARTYPTWITPEALRAGLVAVNAAVHARAEGETDGMGTTIAGVVIAQGLGLCFNVGDSRTYRITDGYVEQLTIDDATIGPDGKQTGRLTQALGGPPNLPLDPHVTEVALDGPTRFLLCTDGVTSVLDNAAFRRLCRVATLRDLVTGLRDAVYEAGAEDNLTIVAIDVPVAPSMKVGVSESSPDD